LPFPWFIHNGGTLASADILAYLGAEEPDERTHKPTRSALSAFKNSQV
jgi:hypothetical protein